MQFIILLCVGSISPLVHTKPKHPYPVGGSGFQNVASIVFPLILETYCVPNPSGGLVIDLFTRRVSRLLLGSYFFEDLLITISPIETKF